MTPRPSHVPADRPPRLGSWARAGTVVGVVARVDGDMVTVFDPAGRRRGEATVAAVSQVPAAAVRVTVTVDLPLAHGLDETALRRWTAMLIDPVLRERATAALEAEQLDPGAALPDPSVEVSALRDGLGRCLCGASVAAPDALPGPGCPRCGRQVALPADA